MAIADKKTLLIIQKSKDRMFFIPIFIVGTLKLYVYTYIINRNYSLFLFLFWVSSDDDDRYTEEYSITGAVKMVD